MSRNLRHRAANKGNNRRQLDCSVRSASDGKLSATDLTGDTLETKILNAEIARWNCILGKSSRRLRLLVYKL